jgi:hypothetical protein
MSAFRIGTIVLVLGQASSLATAENQQPTAVVTEAAAEVSIPIVSPPDGVWVWNQSDTQVRALEYSWDVRVVTPSGEYTFGFYKFKNSGASEASGSLEELLNAGQRSVWKPASGPRGGATVMAGVTPSVSVGDGAMLVQITDAALVHQLFAHHPATVSVHAKTPDADAAYKVRVSYRE